MLTQIYESTLAVCGGHATYINRYALDKKYDRRRRYILPIIIKRYIYSRNASALNKTKLSLSLSLSLPLSISLSLSLSLYIYIYIYISLSRRVWRGS